MVSKFLRGWLVFVLLICMTTNVILAEARVWLPVELATQPVTTTTGRLPATPVMATAIPIPLLAAPAVPNPTDVLGSPANKAQISTWHPLHPVVIISVLCVFAVVSLLVAAALQPQHWGREFPQLFVTALVYLLGGTTVALLVYLLFPTLASGMLAKLSTSISAGGTLLLIVLLAAKELVPATATKRKALLRALNLAMLPLWILFVITVVSRLLALVQF